jgi:hypothetical protein
MAMACLRFFTGCFPERMCFISVSTSLPALGLYRRLLDFFLLEFVLLRLELDLLLLDRFFELDFFFEPLFVAIIILPSYLRRKKVSVGWQQEVRCGGRQTVKSKRVTCCAAWQQQITR